MTMFETVGKWIIPIVILILLAVFYYGGGGAFDKLKGVVPNISFGTEELTAEKPTLPKEHEQAVRKLAETIESMIGSSRKNCFENYKFESRAYSSNSGLPDLQEEGTVIELSKDSLVVKRGKQVVTDVTRSLKDKVRNFEPCVIAGPSVTENFEVSFLTDEKGYLSDRSWNEKKPNLKSNHYHAVPTIIIASDGENRISYGPGPKEANSVDAGSGLHDLKDGGYLYTPDNRHICFFPTVNWGTDEDGLDAGYLGEQPTFISQWIKDRKLVSCTGLLPPEQSPIASPPPSPDEILPGGVPG